MGSSGAGHDQGMITKSADTTRRQSSPPPAPPAPPLPRWRSRSSLSVTRREIDHFWRNKRWVEEDHFLAAIKAAARLRATHLSEKDYMVFMESLNEEEEDVINTTNTTHSHNNHEIRVGIKDWWTKSKYAYLNQPAVGSTARPSPRSRSNYIPNKFVFYNYLYNYDHYNKLSTIPPANITTPLQPPYLGVF